VPELEGETREEMGDSRQEAEVARRVELVTAKNPAGRHDKFAPTIA
jgi:hypothetical protein